MQGGKKVPPHLQRFRSEDLLSLVFPQSTGCLENHHGDVVIPDHPLVRQTVDDGLHEAMDLEGWLATLEQIARGEISLVPCDTREPSPFCHEILSANPYAFLDDAPLEERRTRAVATRRGLPAEELSDLARLDETAIDQVRDEAWPLVRDEDELHDALLSLVVADEAEVAPWSHWLQRLVAAGRATQVRRPDAEPLWSAAENWPLVAAVYPAAEAQPEVDLPEALRRDWPRSDAVVALLRGRIQHAGPLTAAALAAQFRLEPALVTACLEALEGEGVVLRGKFSSGVAEPAQQGTVEWCDRRLLARIHRLTLTGLRQRIKPVEPEAYLRFLVRYHRLDSDEKWGGVNGTREVITRLQGFEAPAGAWESQLLAVRVPEYDPQCLDHLFMAGELVWGRLKPPRREEGGASGLGMLTRTVPISLVMRDDLGWLLPPQPAVDPRCRSNAAAVLGALTNRGALFFAQLQAETELLPTHLEEALRELATLGLVTSDSYAAVRAIVDRWRGRGGGRTRGGRKRSSTARAPAGRWSLFPGRLGAVQREQQVGQWCQLLLQRYGVLFRELLTRESAAPPWHELVSLLRRLEGRGQLRGGRFVAGVAGEQFAREEAIQLLRAVRDEPPDDPRRRRWVVISAADPLNLVGIVTPGRRIPASHKAALVLQNGRCVGVKQAGAVTWENSLEGAERSEIEHALRRC